MSWSGGQYTTWGTRLSGTKGKGSMLRANISAITWKSVYPSKKRFFTLGPKKDWWQCTEYLVGVQLSMLFFRERGRERMGGGGVGVGET